jgi:hypothetical protein
MENMLKNRWFWVFLIFFVLLVSSKGAVLPIIGAAFKYLLIVFLVLLLIGLIRGLLFFISLRKLGRQFEDYHEKGSRRVYQYNTSNHSKEGSQEPPTIEICPQCGSQKGPSHKCR